MKAAPHPTPTQHGISTAENSPMPSGAGRNTTSILNRGGRQSSQERLGWRRPAIQAYEPNEAYEHPRRDQDQREHRRPYYDEGGASRSRRQEYRDHDAVSYDEGAMDYHAQAPSRPPPSIQPSWPQQPNVPHVQQPYSSAQACQPDFYYAIPDAQAGPSAPAIPYPPYPPYPSYNRQGYPPQHPPVNYAPSQQQPPYHQYYARHEGGYEGSGDRSSSGFSGRRPKRHYGDIHYGHVDPHQQQNYTHPPPPVPLTIMIGTRNKTEIITISSNNPIFEDEELSGMGPMETGAFDSSMK